MKKLNIVAWLVLALALAAPGHAANVNIDALPAAPSVGTGDLFECEQGGVNNKCTSDQVKTFVGGGTVTSVATSCGVSGGPITGTGTVKATATPNAQVGTTYAILDADCGKVVTLSNAASIAVSIAQAGTAGSFASGWFVTVINEGAGTATITPATSTIDGAATLTLTTNQSVDLFTDGTNYFTARGRASGGAPSGAAGGDLAGTYPNPTLGFASASAAAAAADADTFPTNQGAGTLKQTLAAIKTWIKSWIAKADVGLGSVPNTDMTNLSNATSGTVAAARMPALTGDCTTSAGAVATTCRQSSPVYIVNNWYAAGAEHSSSGASSSVIPNGHIFCYPEYFHGPATISALGARINTASASGNYQVAVYANNPATGRPTGTALGNSSSLSTTTGAVALNSAVSIAISGNQLLWWCSNSDNGTATISGYTLFLMNAFIGTATQANLSSGSSSLTYVQVTQTFGVWPDLTSGVFTEVVTAAGIGAVQYKIGSVP